MYLDFTVPIPDRQGKIVRRKKKETTYVLFEVARVYDQARKFNIPQRVIIGKACTDDATCMFPNEKYLEYFPDTVLPEERQEAERSCCLKAGVFIVMENIVKEYNLDEMLDKWFGPRAGLLLDLASYAIVNEDNAGQYYPDYAFCHPLFTEKMQVLSDATVSRFFQETTKDQIIGFLDDWNSIQDHKNRIYISYDSTNKNCQAGDIDFVEFGKPKDDKGLPIFNLSLAFDKSNKVPLFYEEYPGSINDVSQLKYLVDKVSEYGYRNLGFILDRGYFSRANLNYMDENRYSFLIMVKGCKNIVSKIIEKYKGTFESEIDCCVTDYGIYGTTISEKLFNDDTSNRYFHIFFDRNKAASEHSKLIATYNKFCQQIKECEGKFVEFSGKITEYFTFHYSNEKHNGISRFLFAEENRDAYRQSINLCGYFCMITSEKMNAKDAFLLYKGRDQSEKLFRADKSFLGSKSMRVHSNESLSTKIFVEFIALIIRNRIYNLLKEEMLRTNIRHNYMTVPAAIKELQKIELVRRNNGHYRLDHAITKNQRTILTAFGIDVDHALKKINTISQDLSENATISSSECEEKDA